jgi:hypothetical protein
MQRSHLRTIVATVATVALVGAAAVITSGVAQGMPDDTAFSQTEARSATTPYSGAGANMNDVTRDADRVTTSNPTDGNQGSFLNTAIPGISLTPNGGLYRTMTNFWNTDVSWSCPALIAKFGAGTPAVTNCTNSNADQDLTTKTLSETLDSQATEFKLTAFTGNTYFANGRTGVQNAQDQTGTCINAAVTDRCHWTPNNFHFPSSYPASYKGCNFGQCSFQLTNGGAVAASAGFPTPLASLVSMQSSWNYALPAGTIGGAGGIFDVAYDIWLDSNTNSNLPSGANSLNQNDGAEVMIWANNHGYSPDGSLNAAAGHFITPAGMKVENQVTIPGAPMGSTWDVWINRQNTDVTGGVQWNIVTFVANPALPSFSADTRAFIDRAMTYNSGDRSDVVAKLDGSNTPSVKQACPTGGLINGVAVPRACVLPSWWLTSVQAGFEIWQLPANGGGLSSQSYSVNPLTIDGDPAFASQNTGITGNNLHLNGDGTTKPILHWEDHARLSYSGCASGAVGTGNTTAPATITFGNGTGSEQVTLTQANGTGIWDGPISPTQPGHDSSTISFTLPCGDNIASAPIFIDPSGHVVNQDNMPINGATVTLGLCANGAASTAPCPAVAPGSSIITPNRNPQTTPDSATVGSSGPGSFRWDVSGDNFWTVTASAPGCNTVTLGPLEVPPPRIDLFLKLTCASDAPGIIEVGGHVRPQPSTGLPTNVVVRAPGITQFGYCADVFVTNNTSAPVTWNTSFTVPGNQHINQMWNMVLTQGGNPNVATDVHANPSNPWNAVLQPGQTTQSVGFCAVP